MISPFTSLRGRFVVAILLWTALGIGSIWISSVQLFRGHVEEHYHEELAVHVEELAALTEIDANGNPRLSRPLSDPRFAVPDSGFYWQVSRIGFGPLKSPSMKRGALDDTIAQAPKIAHRLETGPTGPTIAYGLMRPVESGQPLRFVLSTDERHLVETVDEFSEGLGLSLLALAVALLASGFAIITFGLRPLKLLSLAIANLRSGKVTRLEGSYPQEISPLVDDLNSYAAHCDAIVQRGRVQAGNLAHALRTPLAIIIDEAERMMESLESGSHATVFLEETLNMQRQIDYHLARSKSSGSARSMGAHTELQKVLPPILAAMRRIHFGKSFASAGESQSLAIACDPNDLHEMLSNLIDNAGKWASHFVRITYGVTASEVVIAVVDDGPGIDEDQRELAFDIGTCLNEEKGGSGLGLAISRDIVLDYGGTLTFETTDSGAFAAVVRLPLAEKK